MEELQNEIAQLEASKKEYEEIKTNLENAVNMLLKAKETNSNVAREIVENYISETANKKAGEVEETSVLISETVAKIKNMMLEITSKIQLLNQKIEEARAKLQLL